MLYIFVTVFVIWSLRTAFFITGISKQKKIQTSQIADEELPFVSIIIPARNEEHHIKQCIDSLLSNDYPQNKFEILCINDCSTDATEKILKQYTSKHTNIRYRTLQTSDRPLKLSGKPGALQVGFDIAKGEYILMTDADCIVANKWIRTIVNCFIKDKADMVLGLSHLNYTGLFGQIQSIEWFYMSLLAAGGIGWNMPLGCFGNNLSMSKSIINKTGGFRKLNFSVTEDLLLMQTAHKLKAKIRYLTIPDASIASDPAHSFLRFIKQHHRWTHGGKKLGKFAIFFVFSSVALWTALFASIIVGNPLFFVLTVCTRLIGDLLIMGQTLIAHKQAKLILTFIPLGLISLLLMELISPFFLLKKTVEWKGRKFKL